MPAYSMVPSAFAPILAHRGPVMRTGAIIVVLETAQSKCVEGLDTSTSSTLTHTKQQLMTGDVETLSRIPTTKSGIRTWVTAAQLQVSIQFFTCDRAGP